MQIYDNCCADTAKYPYMRHRLHRNVENCQFCPFEDVLGIGHYDGYTSILVPGWSCVIEIIITISIVLIFNSV